MSIEDQDDKNITTNIHTVLNLINLIIGCVSCVFVLFVSGIPLFEVPEEEREGQDAKTPSVIDTKERRFPVCVPVC